MPQEEGVPLGRWSYAEIARRLVALGVVVSIAVSTIARWLAAEKLKPWRYHTWQHILDPQAFLERARPVLNLYQKAQALWEEGVWVVCVDEKTSIQARQRTPPPEPAIPGQPVHIPSRYRRRGAWQLFAGLSVVDGMVFGQCRERKRFVDFQAFLLETLFPEALKRGVRTLVLILDNSTTHAPKRWEGWLQEQLETGRWPFTVEVHWLPTNASWLNQIEIWFSILQRKVLQPNHFTSLEDLEKTLQGFIAHYNETAKPIRWSYTAEKLEQKLAMN